MSNRSSELSALKRLILLEIIDKQAIFDDNLKFLTTQFHERPNHQMFAYLRHVGRITLKDKIPQLSAYKLLRLLGCGMYKCAFLLGNDHVLSIGTAYQNPEAYRELADRLHSGRATGQDIGVFDYGKITSDLFYVEMSRIVTLSDFVEQTRKIYDINGLSFVVSAIREVIIVLVRKANDKQVSEADVLADVNENIFKYIQDYVRMSQDYGKTSHITQQLTPKEIRGIARAIVHTGMQNIDSIYDAHVNNIGVDIQNPNRIMLFDID